MSPFLGNWICPTASKYIKWSYHHVLHPQGHTQISNTIEEGIYTYHYHVNLNVHQTFFTYNPSDSYLSESPPSPYALPLILAYADPLISDPTITFRKPLCLQLNKPNPTISGQQQLVNDVYKSMNICQLPNGTSLTNILNDPDIEFIIISDGGHKHSGTFAYVIATDTSNEDPTIIATGKGIVNGLLSHMSLF